MKICTYSFSTPYGANKRLGILISDNEILDPNLCWERYFKKEGYFNTFQRSESKLPSSLSKLLTTRENPIARLQEALELYDKLKNKEDGLVFKLTDENISLKAPLDRISNYRDFYAHEKHVAVGFKKRNEPIPEAWYEIPAYYKGPTHGFIGPEDDILWPSYTQVLDYELEMGMIVAKDGINIKEKDACKHILGFTILNDISARDIQKKEMAIRLGPAKGKDFCSVIGPVITTIDEFAGKEPNLKMTAKINGELWSEGQSGDSHFSFSQMIEHVSKDEWLLSGDLFGSGTVGTGCGLELDKWIQEGDLIELEIEKIGILRNHVGKKK